MGRIGIDDFKKGKRATGKNYESNMADVLKRTRAGDSIQYYVYEQAKAKRDEAALRQELKQHEREQKKRGSKSDGIKDPLDIGLKKKR